MSWSNFNYYTLYAQQNVIKGRFNIEDTDMISIVFSGCVMWLWSFHYLKVRIIHESNSI